MATATAAQVEAAQAAIAKKTDRIAAKRDKMLANISEKYPHAIADSLAYDEKAKRWGVEIVCENCQDDTRHVHTSDLWQVKLCLSCKAELDVIKKAERAESAEANKAVRKEQREAQKTLIAAIENGEEIEVTEADDAEAVA